MKVVQINSTCGIGSTGKICVSISKLLSDRNVENYIFYSLGKSSYIFGKRYTLDMQIKIQALKSRLFGNYGFTSKSLTRRLIKKLEKVSPDIVHLHNLHSHNINLEMLFAYLKKNKIKTFWTFHDCWAFTGYCPYYDLVNCEKWKKEGCYGCPQRKKFSWFFDRSKYLFEKKRKLFKGVDMTIITPSQWLADQVKQSFLKEYNVKVINNGIDISIFKPRNNNFKERFEVENKFLIIGVAFGWEKRKGLDVFIRLAERLDLEKFQIVMVGTNEQIDKQLPDNIISIHRTNNQEELAEIYSAADVFVNPTREEVFGLTNIEALACGTPVVTFNTGGSPECIDEKTGIVVDRDDEQALLDAILYIEKNEPFSKEDCRNRALLFDNKVKFKEYCDLYTEGEGNDCVKNFIEIHG